MSINDENRRGERICYLPGRESSYSRNRVLVKAMTMAGFEVRDCSVSCRSFFRYFAAFCKFLANYRKCDIVFVGFLGHCLVPLVRVFTAKKIVFDAFVSVYETMVLERDAFRRGGWLARSSRYLDRLSCRLSDKVILDTRRHIEYFVKEFGLNRDKFAAVPPGADDAVLKPLAVSEEKTFTVHFHGECQSLHGVEFILEAAELLPGVRFRLTGRGKRFRRTRSRALEKGISNVYFFDAVPYEELASSLSKCHVCLGIFGDTPKARMVVPNKIFEALAVQRPVITADTPAVRDVFMDGENVILCDAADPESLARAIARLRDDPALRERVASNGYDLFKKAFSTEAIAKKLKTLIDSVN